MEELTTNPEEWLLRLDYASLQESRKGSTERRLGQVKQLLLSLLPGVSDVDIAGPIDGVRFRTDYGWVPLKGLSLGYQTMIAWTVDLAYRMVERYPNSADPLAEPAVVLVDEIDLHLHPRWQRSIVEFLCRRFPKTQFVVTAHSPLIVQSATDANIALLRRDGDHVVIDNDPERVKTWRYDQLLTSDLFGVDGSRAPSVEKLIDEQSALLAKNRPTKKDRQRLAQIEATLGNVPTAERHEDQEVMDLLRKAASTLKKARRA